MTSALDPYRFRDTPGVFGGEGGARETRPYLP